ncbi:TIGR02444 family protein [Pseudoalteromonas sp. SG45-5]|uniref:TIGR02444 family protein n=1 Tax=unclassified Pseudoalteromonas TaxID=194690 RepID=UPI0015F8508D|nr:MULTISPECIES: TIGR02444 family protein [unclassified Pseudoalteromonas]MBB1385266.1 TIGR02444 family protein [Pseudoalteromonas sp. SG45-5]MBB1393110.1 TIGR02444 family protein [Pseudoalteromonas sp. SG44-4]MBB1445639.1 TIGR02444 family protein [Pseudoalteromonas sp. SG41-6]
MNLLNSDHFWQFACTLYAKPGQQTTLLALQNQQGKNVNLCLLLLYLDSLKLSINAQQLNELTQVVSEFDTQVLQPLRTARSYLKINQNTLSDYATIRAELLSAELKLEKQQQHMLIEAVNGFEFVADPEPNNIELYVKAT